MGIFRDLLLVLAIIALAYSYTTDRSMKSLIDNPPPFITEMMDNGTNKVDRLTDSAVEQMNNETSRMEEAVKESQTE